MTEAKETARQIEYYSRAMKAPRIQEAAARLARPAGPMRNTSPRSSPGKSPPGKTPAPNPASGQQASPVHKSPDDFSFDHPPGLKRDTIAYLATGTFLSEASNIVQLGPPGIGKHTSRPAWGCGPPSWATESCSRPRSTGSPGSRPPSKTGGRPGTGPAAPLPADHRR
jgi:hypothetical protein